ncbi:hypothetical protein [Streptomyces violascens]|uniref:hypothetical protein n=1 Tax=Streptomyces violascens TaxID=67381 RepID=UPI0036B18CB1
MAVLTVTVTVPLTSTVHAAGVDAQCTGTQHITYSPGLRLLNQTVTTTGSTTYNCTGQVTSGHTSFTATDSRSCLSAVGGDFTTTITWNDESTSTITGTATVATVAGNTVVTRTGTVTAGRFQGAQVLEVATGPTIASLTACIMAPGLTSTNEYLTLTITPL